MILKQYFLGEADSYRELEAADFVNKAYRRIFVEEESKIGNKRELLHAISDLSAFLLQCEELEEIRAARRKNYLLLGELLSAAGILLYGVGSSAGRVFRPDLQYRLLHCSI